MKLRAFKTNEGGWGGFHEQLTARANEPSKSPVEVTGTAEQITLVPYGATELRITCFPWSAE